MEWETLFLTARLAAATTAALLFLGIPLAWWLATTTWRGRFLVEALVALPIVLPPTVIGFYLLLFMGPQGHIGKFLDMIGVGTLPFTFTGLLVGSIIFNLPFAVRPFTSAFSAIDKRHLEASWCLGASRLRTFRRVVLPGSWPGILSGLILTFAHTVGEFGVVLMLGGNIPGQTRTVSVAIYDHVQALDYAAASDTALILVGLAFTALSLTYALQKRVLPL